MRVLRSNINQKVLIGTNGKILKVRPDTYVEVKPDVFMFEIEVDDNQVFTLPTPNNVSYYTGASYSNSPTLTYNYIVSWGDGSAPVVINSYNHAAKVHNFVKKGTYVIEITGVFQAFMVNSDNAIRLLITRVISWGSVGLQFVNLYGCSAMVTLPDQRSKLTGVKTFVNFCNGCSSLVSVPYGLFFGCTIATDFSYAFYGCASLRTINSETFLNCTSAYNFQYTFGVCTKLQAVPDALFASCPLVKNFAYTFYSCTVLAALPASLFYYNTASGCQFTYTFGSCIAITSVPTNFFINVKGSSFAYCFYNCTSLTSIPAYLFQDQSQCTGFTYTFASCTKLASVPIGVFDGCTAVTDMSYTFSSCTLLSTIADGLFNSLYNVTSFYMTFYNCSVLSAIPSGLFDNCTKVISFDYCFGQHLWSWLFYNDSGQSFCELRKCHYFFK